MVVPSALTEKMGDLIRLRMGSSFSNVKKVDFNKHHKAHEEETNDVDLSSTEREDGQSHYLEKDDEDEGVKDDAFHVIRFRGFGSYCSRRQ